jgi:hypothetical protein
MRMARGRAGSGLATAPRTGLTGRFGLDIETSDGSRFTSAKLVSGMAVPSSTPSRGAGGSSSEARSRCNRTRRIERHTARASCSRGTNSGTGVCAVSVCGPKIDVGVCAFGKSCGQNRGVTQAHVTNSAPPANVKRTTQPRTGAGHATACSNIVDLPSCGYTGAAVGLSVEPSSPGLAGRLSPIDATVGDEVPA